MVWIPPPAVHTNRGECGKMTAMWPFNTLGSVPGGHSPKGQLGLRRFGGAFVVG